MPKVDVSKLPVLYTLPNMDQVAVKRDTPYLDDAQGKLLMDVYYPPNTAATATPAVVDPGHRTRRP